MAGQNDPQDGTNWSEDDHSDLNSYGDEEEFNEEDWEKHEAEEEGNEGSASRESSETSVLHSERTGSNAGSGTGSDQEGDEEEDSGSDAEGMREDGEEEEEAEEGDPESTCGSGGEEDGLQSSTTNFNTKPAAAFSFGSAPTSSAFSRHPALTTATGMPGNTNSAFPRATFANPSAVSSAFGQTGPWPSAAIHDGSSSASNFAVPAPTAAVVSFPPATPPLMGVLPSPTPIIGGGAKSNVASASTVEVKNSMSGSREQTVSPAPVRTPVSQGKSAAATLLQFEDFKRSFGQNQHHTRSAEDEAAVVKALLARYELVVPTDKFDDQIERALYGC
ncbi:hypothetical protein ABL78_8212 [Leptomonas seymouri]|uniref:Uncharacterized protein n=1 Tax=Leptomonas seymouri TaxID=5684 RepID=A0A0N1P934_LEPSE|nr:hypothetical protein ABL78_8212 [Leptomonas seymouri]|eukprot:KPI82775.1 hypothetical protein ABL78_8212 [Leptomonas seymouri]